MATITKRESGRWQAKVRLNGVQKSGTFRTKGEAVAWAAAVEAELSAVRAGAIPSKTFGELLEKYITEEVPKKRGGRQDEIRLRRFIRTSGLADLKLAEIGPEHLSAWRDRRLKEVQPDSVRRELSTLSGAFSVAIKEWGWLRSNPLQQISKPAKPPARTRLPTEDEIARLVLACGYAIERLPDTKQARVGAAFLFALETAMRAGEICGIRAEHIDFERRLVHLPMTKNGFARDVPLSREAVRLLQHVQPFAEPQSWFGLSAGTLDALFRKAKTRALVEGLHFHDSRAAALTALAKKFNPFELAKISGHRDLRILMNTYYREDPASLVSKLD